MESSHWCTFISAWLALVEGSFVSCLSGSLYFFFLDCVCKSIFSLYCTCYSPVQCPVTTVPISTVKSTYHKVMTWDQYISRGKRNSKKKRMILQFIKHSSACICWWSTESVIPIIQSATVCSTGTLTTELCFQGREAYSLKVSFCSL